MITKTKPTMTTPVMKVTRDWYIPDSQSTLGFLLFLLLFLFTIPSIG
ncbi:MAG: hypothetical protein IJO93_06825 [Clostridia bacterium]|nr:hypothetical protein [Clostridia bacterium]